MPTRQCYLPNTIHSNTAADRTKIAMSNFMPAILAVPRERVWVNQRVDPAISDRACCATVGLPLLWRRLIDNFMLADLGVSIPPLLGLELSSP
jgi:hypothetical protein